VLNSHYNFQQGTDKREFMGKLSIVGVVIE
jgi:hypothetical protein